MQLLIKTNVPLAPLTTLGVGGNARFLAMAQQVSDVEEAVKFARQRKLRLFVLGGGSNLVIADAGWDGLALQIGLPGIAERQEQENVLLEAGAGVEWDSFVAYAVSRNYAGVECLSGIPGSVGGTPVQNVGAYGQEVSDTIASVLVFDLATHSVRELSAADCRFSYRTSVFNTGQRERYIILRVSYRLVPEGSPSLLYADLQKYFAGRDGTPTLTETRDAVRNIRSNKGMLLSPGDPDGRSAGSFFKNPVLSAKQHEELMRRASERNLQVPSYPALSQQRKISAAWLVENSGIGKGYCKGPAAISTRHALAIVNRGGATAGDILALSNEVVERVEQTWGIRLEAEPVLVGF